MGDTPAPPAPPAARPQPDTSCPARLAPRAAAKLVDWFVAGFAYAAAVGWWAFDLPWIERSAALTLAVLLALPAVWLTWSVYSIVLSGRTVGKRLFGLEVVTEVGEPARFGRNFGRVWAETLSGGLLGLGYLFALADPERRTLHDHLCGTQVVARPP